MEIRRGRAIWNQLPALFRNPNDDFFLFSSSMKNLSNFQQVGRTNLVQMTHANLVAHLVLLWYKLHTLMELRRGKKVDIKKQVR